MTSVSHNTHNHVSNNNNNNNNRNHDGDDGMDTEIPTNVIYLGREILGELNLSESREFLVTNGIGGYASLTLANSLTRSYHGLLVAALKPPLDRTLLLTKLNETVVYHDKVYHLATDRRKEQSVKKQTIIRKLSSNINNNNNHSAFSSNTCTTTNSTTSSSSSTTNRSDVKNLSLTIPNHIHNNQLNTCSTSTINDSVDTNGFIYPIWKPPISPSSSSYTSSSSLNIPPFSSNYSNHNHSHSNNSNSDVSSPRRINIQQRRTAIDEVISPYGFELLQSFYLEGTVPVFVYNFSDAILEKRIWMKQGKNTTYVTYYLKKSSQAIQLKLKALVNHRNHHRRTCSSNSHFNYSSNVGCDGCSVSVLFTIPNHPNYTNLCMRVNRGRALLTNQWINGFVLSEERSRGLPHEDDNLHVATFVVELPPGGKVTFMASAEIDSDDICMDGDLELVSKHDYEKQLLKQFQVARFNDFKTSKHHLHQPHQHEQSNFSSPTAIDHNLNSNERQMVVVDKKHQVDQQQQHEHKKYKSQLKIDPVIKQLVLAADQFIITRAGGRSVVAGFHWFADWARDTMISLPGLTIATGRFDVARSILLTYSKYVSQGMLPNRFPDDGSAPTENDYDNADGTLWYFEAIRAYYAATNDVQLLLQLYPILQSIIDHHVRGTRFNIRQDNDGLLRAGAEGYALTWMDAKADTVYTPRRGKPVELGALWYNALQCMTYFSDDLEKLEESEKYSTMSDLTERSFQYKFWNEKKQYCYDVIECNNVVTHHDDSLRPNQLIAISLNWSPLTIEQKYKILEICEKDLIISHAIRTLSPDDAHGKYKGIYFGDVFNRDSAYHQGIGWTWLLGPFILSHLKVFGNKRMARQFLYPILKSHLNDAGCGQISELFDGDPPHRAKGCIAQAWSVAEILRAYLATEPTTADN